MSALAFSSTGGESTDESVDIEGFLGHLDTEQRCFLAAIHDAQRLVLGNDQRLGDVVAEQIRLLRRLLDAQRAIIRRCAETDRAVAELLETASFNSLQVRESADAAIRALAVDLDVDAAAPVCRRAFEAEALCERISDQLERSHPVRDGADSDRPIAEQWNQLLDRAWRDENQRCHAALTAARTDADIEVHDARIAARDSIAVARRRARSKDTLPEPVPSVLAPPMLDALDRADDDSLEDFIDGLLHDLHTEDPLRALVDASARQLAASLDVSPTYLEVDGRRVEDEAFRRFWALTGLRHQHRPHRTIRAARNWVPSVGLVAGAVSWFVR
jgi:hypothetical protein